ncbi:ATP-binding cassette domain-containing protein, partial [Streptomyces sp. DSM 44915]
MLVGGREISSVPANKRDMGMVFQAYSLFPHLTVLDNVAFGLKMRGKSKQDRLFRAADMLDLVGLSAHKGKYASELSGGEQQRVALARSLVRNPALLLADEPFGALDALTRVRMHHLLKELCAKYEPGVLLVTHDVDEAVTLADRVLVLDGGAFV